MNTKMIVWLVATALLFNASFAQAQQTGKIFRVGFLDPSTPAGSAVLVDAFREEMSKLGWIEGKNIIIEQGLLSKSLSVCLSLPRRLGWN